MFNRDEALLLLARISNSDLGRVIVKRRGLKLSDQELDRIMSHAKIHMQSDVDERFYEVIVDKLFNIILERE